MTRATLVTSAALALVLVTPLDADAHTRTEETTNVDSRIVHDPGLPGVDWTVHTGGLAIEVANRGHGVLVIEGYDGEPYLRVGPDGVERNRHSPATYLNRERFGDIALPPAADPSAPPDWVSISSEPRHTWHDHRVHWMAPQPPGFVEVGPFARALMDMRIVGPIGRAGDDVDVFQQWTIPVRHDGRSYALGGELAWVDPPSALPWLGLATLLLVPALAGLRRATVAGIVRPAALVVGLVAAVNGVHLVDDLIAWPSDPLDDLFGLLHTTVFLTAGIGGAVWAWRESTGRVLALGLGSAALLYHQGVVHLPMLFASQFPTVWPDGLIRLTIALGAMQTAVVLPVVIRARRCAPAVRGGDPTRGLTTADAGATAGHGRASHVSHGSPDGG